MSLIVSRIVGGVNKQNSIVKMSVQMTGQPKGRSLVAMYYKESAEKTFNVFEKHLKLKDCIAVVFCKGTTQGVPGTVCRCFD